MALLIDVYNDLVKEATEVETKELLAERVEVLDKYATLATELLNAEFPNDYDKNDVIALADKLIERDIAISEVQEKQAEAKELLGEYVKVARDLMVQEYAENFKDADVEKLASTLYEMDCEDEFSKEAQAIVEYAFLQELNKIAGTEFTSLEEVKEVVKEANAATQALAHVPGKGKSFFVPNTLGRIKALAQRNPKSAIGAAVGAAGLAGFGAGRASKTSGGDN